MYVNTYRQTPALGFGLMGDQSRSFSAYDHVVLARRCEVAGFTSFWVADHPWMSDPFVTLGTVGRHAKNVSVGTRVTNPHIRHPSVTAKAVALLDAATNGRVALGIGAGSRARRDSRRRRSAPDDLRDAVQRIRAAWSPPAETRLAEGIGGSGWPASRHPTQIPIFIASRSPRILELAGEIADGVILATGANTHSARWAAGCVATGAAHAGRRDLDVRLLHMTYISANAVPRLAVLRARAAAASVVLRSYPNVQFLTDVEPLPRALNDYLVAGGSERDRIAELLTDDLVQRIVVTGTPDQCIDKIYDLTEVGVQHFTFAPVGDQAGIKSTIEHIFNDIAPEIFEG